MPLDQGLFLKEAEATFLAWLATLSPEERAQLAAAGICDFSDNHSSRETLLLEDEDKRDYSDRLTCGTLAIKYPRGLADFEAEFFNLIEPESEEPSGHHALDAQSAVVIIVSELAVCPDLRASVIALCVVSRWGQDNGFDACRAARELGVAPGGIKRAVETWRKVFDSIDLTEDVLCAIRKILDELTTAGNVRTSIMALAFATGWGLRNGLTQMEVSKSLGCSRQNFSKFVVAWRAILDIPAIISGKSPEACVSFREAQLQKHWRRKDIWLAAQVDKAPR